MNPNKSRDRKAAAKSIGFDLQAKYRAMLTATTKDEIENAAIDLGATFNTQIEFIIWTLKEYGGVVQLPFEPGGLSRLAPPPQTALPQTPVLFAVPTTGDLKKKH